MSLLLKQENLIGVDSYAYYLFAFVFLVAAAECYNSLNLKVRHKIFFVISAFTIVLVEIMHLFNLPFAIESPLIALIYMIMAAYLFFNERKKIKSRLAILVLWTVYFLDWFSPWFSYILEVF